MTVALGHVILRSLDLRSREKTRDRRSCVPDRRGRDGW